MHVQVIYTCTCTNCMYMCMKFNHYVHTYMYMYMYFNVILQIHVHVHVFHSTCTVYIFFLVRTFPSHQLFMEECSVTRSSLLHIMMLYSTQYNKTVGYCQGTCTCEVTLLIACCVYILCELIRDYNSKYQCSRHA